MFRSTRPSSGNLSLAKAVTYIQQQNEHKTRNEHPKTILQNKEYSISLIEKPLSQEQNIYTDPEQRK
jgi:hypothetical protein